MERAVSLFFSRSLILAAVAGIVAGVLLSWTLLAPLQELTRGAEAIAARELAHRVRVRGSRELRAVAESFNHMAGRLEQAETLRRQLLDVYKRQVHRSPRRAGGRRRAAGRRRGRIAVWPRG